MGGLNISEFLQQTSDQGNRGAWLKNWRPDNVGEITVWLHTQAPIVPSFNHVFMLEDEVNDKETGRPKQILRYPRFVSPDPKVVHENQYFREGGELRVLPDQDPFLILREWLRKAEHIGLNDAVFEWRDFKNKQRVTWERGELSGLEKRGKQNFGHSLDTKTEFVYVVIDNADLGSGIVLAREGKLLGQKMGEVIKQQMSQFGEEEGDPKQHPYAFRWVARSMKTVKSPMDSYVVYKDEKAKLTDEVRGLIEAEEYPDPLPHGQPGDGDMVKIRDAMEKAAKVELPFDLIFSEDPEERRALITGRAGKRTPPKSKAANPPAPKAAAVPPPQAAAPAAAPAAAGRRKKVDKPAEPPPELIPCEDCSTPMLPTEAKCAKCGAEYEVDAPAAPPPAAAKVNGAKKGQDVKAPASIASNADDEAGEESPATECWSCGAALTNGSCTACGIDQGDQLPF